MRVNGGHQAAETGRVTSWFLLAICAASLIGAVTVQRGASESTPEQIVNELMVAVSEKQETDIERLVAALQQRGEAAISAISAALSQADDRQRTQLARALGGIGGDASTSLLVAMVAHTSSPNAAARALSALQNRPVRRPLSSGELSALVTQVENSSAVGAGGAARVLANCRAVAPEKRLTPILERFKSELLSPSPVDRGAGTAGGWRKQRNREMVDPCPWSGWGYIGCR